MLTFKPSKLEEKVNRFLFFGKIRHKIHNKIREKLGYIGKFLSQDAVSDAYGVLALAPFALLACGDGDDKNYDDAEDGQTQTTQINEGYNYKGLVDFGEKGLITVCHKPGTPAEKTKYVPEPALDRHLNHGDYLGECEEDDNEGHDGSNHGKKECTTICHKPGTPAEKTMCVPEPAL